MEQRHSSYAFAEKNSSSAEDVLDMDISLAKAFQPMEGQQRHLATHDKNF